MSTTQTFQLPPSTSFTEPQRRELNALLLRMGQTMTPVLFGALIERPDPGIPSRLFIDTVSQTAPRLYVDIGSDWIVVA